MEVSYPHRRPSNRLMSWTRLIRPGWTVCPSRSLRGPVLAGSTSQGACGIDRSPIDDPQHFGTSALPDQASADAKHMPIYHDHDGNDRRLFVGIDQGTEHVGRLPVTGHRGTAEIRHGRLNDGAGQSTVSAYLPDAIGNSVERHDASPVVRLIGPASRDDRNRVAAAVRLVNAALPESAKMTIGLADVEFQPARQGGRKRDLLRLWQRTGQHDLCRVRARGCLP